MTKSLGFHLWGMGSHSEIRQKSCPSHLYSRLKYLYNTNVNTTTNNSVVSRIEALSRLFTPSQILAHVWLAHQCEHSPWALQTSLWHSASSYSLFLIQLGHYSTSQPAPGYLKHKCALLFGAEVTMTPFERTSLKSSKVLFSLKCERYGRGHSHRVHFHG